MRVFAGFFTKNKTKKKLNLTVKHSSTRQREQLKCQKRGREFPSGTWRVKWTGSKTEWKGRERERERENSRK